MSFNNKLIYKRNQYKSDNNIRRHSFFLNNLKIKSENKKDYSQKSITKNNDSSLIKKEKKNEKKNNKKENNNEKDELITADNNNILKKREYSQIIIYKNNTSKKCDTTYRANGKKKIKYFLCCIPIGTE